MSRNKKNSGKANKIEATAPEVITIDLSDVDFGTNIPVPAELQNFSLTTDSKRFTFKWVKRFWNWLKRTK
mgnify:FL=1